MGLRPLDDGEVLCSAWLPHHASQRPLGEYQLSLDDALLNVGREQ